MLITPPQGFEHLRTRGMLGRASWPARTVSAAVRKPEGYARFAGRRLVEQTARSELFGLPKSRSSLLASLSGMYTLVHTLFLATKVV
jgi:hypothetical protein